MDYFECIACFIMIFLVLILLSMPFGIYFYNAGVCREYNKITGSHFTKTQYFLLKNNLKIIYKQK
jgi:hypothetical protein